MTTNFPNGISTADRGTELERLILPDPTQAHVYFNDFTTYVAGDWTITTTEGGTGNASEALTNVAGGALLITNDDADNDSDEFQLAVESFKFASGKKSWFKTRFKVSDATQSDWIIGLCITDTTLIDAMSDGVYFKKDDGDASIDFALELNGSATEASGIATNIFFNNDLCDFPMPTNGTIKLNTSSGIGINEITQSSPYKSSKTKLRSKKVIMVEQIMRI